VEEKDNKRFIVLCIAIGLLAAILIWRLCNLQIVNGEQYLAMSTRRFATSLVDKAPRGEILDRNGKPLVGNRVGYSLQLQKTDMPNDEFNDMLLKLLEILDESEYDYYDSLPVTTQEPYEFNFQDDNENGSTEDEKEAWFAKQDKTIKANPSMSPNELMQYYKEKKYKLREGYTPEEERRIIGIRYETGLRGFSMTSPFVVAEDVDINVVTKIKERQTEFDSVIVTTDYMRNYEQGTLAAHVLGRTGKMNAEEYETYKEKNYGYNDIIGKQGIEKIAEEHLRGEDGTQGVEQNVNGKVVKLVDDVAAKPGASVTLTLDSNLQRVAEESLARNIEKVRREGGNPDARRGGDANAGAVVVIDIKNGDNLVNATYPTYDPAQFNKNYQTLSQDKNKPMWNRAISGTYTPGSTFKPLTAIASLECGAIGLRETIRDEGKYKFYEDYQPTCWIWNEQHRTHGNLDVSGAIENSCNYFFYEVGRRLGIDKLDEYAKKFGLGELTGIELEEEVKGYAAGPESKQKIGRTEDDKRWYGGDTIQAAIGQSIHSFTPIQLANYAATIANGGTRYKTHIIKNIRSSEDGSLVSETKPEVAEKIDLKPSTLAAVKNGMERVVDEGSASSIFQDYPIKIGGKTGTAQVGKKSTNNALFIAFAPFDDPEIAVAVVMEHGLRGANAGYVAKDIFDEYFKLNNQTVPDNYGSNELLP
jgi:penicillin-binding protein 2